MGTKTLWRGYKFVIKDPKHAILWVFDNELETYLFWLGLLMFAPLSVTHQVRTFRGAPFILPAGTGRDGRGSEARI